MNKSVAVSTFSLIALMGGVVACTPSKEDQPPKPKVTSASPGVTAPAASVAAPPSVTAPVATVPLPVLGKAPTWRLEDLAGKAVSSDEFKGKVVVVDFWATWCGPCKVEIPGYIALQEKYGKDGLAIVGISIDQAGPEVVKSFVEKNGLNYRVVMASEEVGKAFGGVELIPTTFLIDRKGQIRDRKEGVEDSAEYERKIAAVMAEKA